MHKANDTKNWCHRNVVTRKSLIPLPAQNVESVNSSLQISSSFVLSGTTPSLPVVNETFLSVLLADPLPLQAQQALSTD